MLLTSLRDESKQTLRDNKGDTTKELYVRIGHPQPPAVYIVRGLAPSPDSSSSNPFDLSTANSLSVQSLLANDLPGLTIYRLTSLPAVHLFNLLSLLVNGSTG